MNTQVATMMLDDLDEISIYCTHARELTTSCWHLSMWALM